MGPFTSMAAALLGNRYTGYNTHYSTVVMRLAQDKLQSGLYFASSVDVEARAVIEDNIAFRRAD